MIYNQIFSLMSNQGDGSYKIENIIVADNYEIAASLARNAYGDDAIVVDTTLYPVSIGMTYKDGIFYNSEEVEVEKQKSEEEKITELESNVEKLQSENTDLKERLEQTQEAIDYLLML